MTPRKFLNVFMMKKQKVSWSAQELVGMNTEREVQNTF